MIVAYRHTPVDVLQFNDPLRIAFDEKV